MVWRQGGGLDFNQVRYFLALASTLNFTRAAEQCYVSQPALTQSIKRLESELGGELIDRRGREMRLTKLGTSLYRHFEDIDRMRLLVRSTAKAVASGEVAELNIGVMCTVGPRLLVPLLDQFRRRYPRVSLLLHDVTPDKVDELLTTGTLDAAVCAGGLVADEGLVHYSLYEEEFVALLPQRHALANKGSASLEEMVAEPYLDRLYCDFRHSYLDFCERKGLQPTVVLRSQREDWLQSMVSQGAGVTVVPLYSVVEPALEVRPLDVADAKREVKLAVLDRQPQRGVLQLLIDEIAGFDWSAVPPTSG